MNGDLLQFTKKKHLREHWEIDKFTGKTTFGAHLEDLYPVHPSHRLLFQSER